MSAPSGPLKERRLEFQSQARLALARGDIRRDHKPLLERAAQSGNDDRGQKKKGNTTDRLHSVDVVLIEPLDDLGHIGLVIMPTTKG